MHVPLCKMCAFNILFFSVTITMSIKSGTLVSQLKFHMLFIYNCYFHGRFKTHKEFMLYVYMSCRLNI